MISSTARSAYLVLRLGAALAFLYPPLNALFDPGSWIGYFPSFILDTASSLHIGDEVLLHSFGVVEVVVGLWILSGWRIFWPCMLATLMLVAIVAFNLAQFQIVFRDLSIAAMTLSLGLINRQESRGGGQA